MTVNLEANFKVGSKIIITVDVKSIKVERSEERLKKVEIRF